jgi:hypothetical protein
MSRKAKSATYSAGTGKHCTFYIDLEVLNCTGVWNPETVCQTFYSFLDSFASQETELNYGRNTT